MVKTITLLGCVVLLAACGDVNSTDPRQGGLIGGIQGIQSGAYQSRIDQLERTSAGVSQDIGQIEEKKAAERRKHRRLNTQLANTEGG